MVNPSPDWSKCPASDITGPDLPSTWSDTGILQCGFIYPSQQPLEEFADCCLNDPAVENDCFQYCQTDNSNIFGGCVLMNIALNQSLQVSCNTQTAAANTASGIAKDVASNWKVRIAVWSLAALAFL